MGMQPGIFARTFARPTLEENLDAVANHGLQYVQFNMSCAGPPILPTLPDSIDLAHIERIRRETAARTISISALSGTYNMLHPDPALRKLGLQRLRVLASVCKGMGTSIITLCTGTRDASDMWRWHPENATAQAWRDLCSVMEEALHIAEDEQVTLAFEPEQANVVQTASQARRLLDTMQSSRLKVVIDPANLFTLDNAAHLSSVLEQAFALLGADIVVAHAKDRLADGTVAAAGMGILDYDRYIHLLRSIHFTGPLILHSLDEAQVPAAVCFLTAKLQAVY
ncbi:MAG: sugar phosphate isomerase/epimerase [Ktedonobacteraceae bacterium]